MEGLSPALTADVCNASGLGASPIDLMRSPTVRRRSRTDMFADDWLPLGAAYIHAALTLPQPFTMVESGNFCGGATIFFALLKRACCPSCAFVSLDPGGYRAMRRERQACTSLNLERATVTYRHIPSHTVTYRHIPLHPVTYRHIPSQACTSLNLEWAGLAADVTLVDDVGAAATVEPSVSSTLTTERYVTACNGM